MKETLKYAAFASLGLGMFVTATACAKGGAEQSKVKHSPTTLESPQRVLQDVKGLARGDKISSVRVIKPPLDTPQTIDLYPTQSAKPEDLAVIYAPEYSATLRDEIGVKDPTQAVGYLFNISETGLSISRVIFDGATGVVNNFTVAKLITSMEPITSYVNNAHQGISVSVAPLAGEHPGARIFINQPVGQPGSVPNNMPTTTMY